MTDDVLDRLEAQLLEAHGRRPAPRGLRVPAFLPVAAGLLAVLAICGGLVALVGARDDPAPAHTQTAAGPTRTRSLRPPLQVLPARSGATGPTGTTDPARFPAQALPLCPVRDAAAGARGVVRLTGATVALQASGLRPSNRYLVWFFNSPTDAVPIGFARYDRKHGRIAGAVQGLPRQAEQYRYLVVSRETGKRVTRPRPLLRSRPITARGVRMPRASC